MFAVSLNELVVTVRGDSAFGRMATAPRTAG